MVKLVGAAGGAGLMTTVPAWMVVVVVEAAVLSVPPSEPMKETSTTPAPMTKMARPRISIWVDRRIAMESPWTVLLACLERAERPLTSFVGWVPGIPDSPAGSFELREWN